MPRFPLIVVAVAILASPVLAQRLPQPPNPNPTSSAEVLNEPLVNPVRNTPVGRAPLMEPISPANPQPVSVGALDACKSRMVEVGSAIDRWAVSQRKTNALLELRAARIAALGGDPRTCNAHLDTALTLR